MMFRGMTSCPIPATFSRPEEPCHMVSCAGIIARSLSKAGKLRLRPIPASCFSRVVSTCVAWNTCLPTGPIGVSMSYMIVGRDLGQVRGLLFESVFGAYVPWGRACRGRIPLNYGPKSRPGDARRQTDRPAQGHTQRSCSGRGGPKVPLPLSSQGPCFWGRGQFFSD